MLDLRRRNDSRTRSKTCGLSAMSPEVSTILPSNKILILLCWGLSHKLNSSCGPRDKSPKVSNLETEAEAPSCWNRT